MDKNEGFHASITGVINLLGEIVVFNQLTFNTFLKRFISLLVKIVPTDSCLIYVYDYHLKQLILVGSKKPHEHAIDHVTMKEGEGITGWVVQHQQTVAIEKKAYLDERFKAFKELPEDKYESFLSVPIVGSKGIIGVVNIQNKKPYVFSKEQIKTVESLVKIIASAFAKTVWERKVNKLESQLEERKIIERAKGILMKEKNMSEDEAFAFIRKEAMNKRKSMKEIADAILLVW